MPPILRNRSFRTLWLASLLSRAGSQVTRMGLILSIFQTTDDAVALALLVAVEAGVGIVAAPFAGAIVDRRSKRGVMIAADLGRALCLAVVVLHPTLPVIYVMVAIHTLGNVLFEPARAAAVPAVVPPEGIPEASSMDRAAAHLMLVAGPLLGAELFGRTGLRATLLVDIASFLASASLLARLPVPSRAAVRTASRTLADVRAGLGYLAGHQVAVPCIWLLFVSLVCVGVWVPLAPFFIRDVLGASGTVLGVQTAVFGVGGVVGAIAAPALTVEAATMTIYAFVRDVGASVVLCLVWGVVVSGIMVPYYAILQTLVDEHFLGRVFSMARQSEALASVLAAAIAAGLHGGLRSDQIFCLAGAVYAGVIIATAATPGGRRLLATR